MDVKNNVRKRREERIRELLSREERQLQLYTRVSNPEDFGYSASSEESVQSPGGAADTGAGGKQQERDPELLWKQGRGLWREDAFGQRTFPSSQIGSGGGQGPGSPEQPDGPQRSGSFIRSLWTRTLVSAVLFGALWGIHHMQPAWSAPIESFVSTTLKQEMDFQAAEAWYERNFGGAPSFIPIFGDDGGPQQLVQSSHGFTIPVQGKLAESFAISLKGVEIVPDLDSKGAQEVKSIETGRVAEVSEDALTGKTVVVQHSDGYVSIYGRLTEVSVSEGDWLEGGEKVGSFAKAESGGSDTVYFAMKKDGLYIDPAEVVPLD
ncbi:hypothetical protein AWM70_13575 [Paenibacillus yonginensis]|uniref:M23ase beta-sheet core domain-containing protein n=1 Tax=Paenibacillus yonginensis TaxID=1462996 RepID=A0A1B1N261_9BACL|nr:M23 family metallopeptidase [Paenibacillus yonginensis]ANS75498.1 hypothetical protein AWM70_13575 [Paenibacillus yonginensis]